MYVCGQLAYSVGMVVMAVFRHPAIVILMSPSAGIMYATLFTMPYLLVANYHTKGQVSSILSFCFTEHLRVRKL